MTAANHREVAFSDVSLTDGQAATWGNRLDGSMMRHAADGIARTGVAAVEVLNPQVLSACVARGEHPLHRVSMASELFGPVHVRVAVNLLLGHGRGGVDVMDNATVGAWFNTLADAGCTQVLILDPFMDLERLTAACKAASRAGITAITGLPFRNDELDDAGHAQLARALISAGSQRVMLRDEAGTLGPDRVLTLVPRIRQVLGTIPLDLHTRCSTGLGPLVALEAVRVGVDGVDAALPCLANGPSVPALTTLLRSLTPDEYSGPRPDVERLLDTDAALREVGDQEGFAASECLPFTLAPYIHQLPGDVVAHAIATLRARGDSGLMHAFADECARIREDVGSPPMLAPFAGAIADQALQHLLDSTRFERLQPVLRRAIQGSYGRLPGQVRNDLHERIGLAPLPTPPEHGFETTALVGLLAGVATQNVPPLSHDHEQTYEVVSPFEALVRGLLKRTSDFSHLEVSAPGLHVELRQGGELHA